MTHRVVITGMAGVTPLGSTWPKVRDALQGLRGGIQHFSDWAAVGNLQTRLGAPVPDFVKPEHYGRKKTRTMGRVALLATRAVELALEQAGLAENPGDYQCGIAFGSTSGSPPSIEQFIRQITVNKTLSRLSASEYIKLMSHTTMSNLAQFFGIKGRLVPTCSACTSGSQGIGYAYEAVKYGKADIMIAGGAEELHVLAAAVFDIMYATSTRNDQPETTPRPFDKQRDGLVVGEGAGALILETLESANKRGVPILAEVVGFATNCDGAHIVSPSVDGMSRVMQAALADARLTPEHIGYINAHGTATEVGDIAESEATAKVLGCHIPISSTKSYMGHTLGACGAIEAWMSVNMMREGWFAPTLHLDDVDERCAPLAFLRKEIHTIRTNYVMSNNFAFGGVNTSLIFRRWQ